VSNVEDRCEKCGMSVTSMAETFANAIGRERARANKLRAAIVDALSLPPRHREGALRSALAADAIEAGAHLDDSKGGGR